MRYTRQSIDRLKEADIVPCFDNVVLNAKGKAKIDCPFCHAARGLNFYRIPHTQRHAAHCFHCETHIENPIKAVQLLNGWKDAIYFRKVIEVAARLCKIELEEE